MHSIKLLLLLSLLISIGCNNKKDAELKKIRDDHELILTMKRFFPDPYDNRIADSMRLWAIIIRNAGVTDQQYRIAGYTNTEEEIKKQQQLDKENQKVITSYLDLYGWPGKYTLGLYGMMAVGMTIQHASLPMQEKYYPMLVKAYKQNPELRETLALLEDRINVRNKRLQYYGTQIYQYKGKQVMYPVYNADSIDAYRKDIGLITPIKLYLGQFKLHWNIEEYKRQLPDMIKDLNTTVKPGLHYVLAK